MTKEGSVAPKERVNIVYRPETGDAREEVELPLKVLVVGDFAQRPDGRVVEDREPISIDKDNFNAVLKAQDLELNLGVEDKLSGQAGAQLSVNLKFSQLKDFDPDEILKQVPELQKLMALREALKSLKSPLSNVPDFRKKVQDLVKDADARARLLKELGIE